MMIRTKQNKIINMIDCIKSYIIFKISNRDFMSNFYMSIITTNCTDFRSIFHNHTTRVPSYVSVCCFTFQKLRLGRNPLKDILLPK